MRAEVAGQVVFDDQGESFRGAILRIKLEDVSRADAVSQEVGHVEIAGCSYEVGDAPLDFSLTADNIDPNGRYEVRVHLDMNGNGEYSAGDQITMESHPVLTLGYPAKVKVQLRGI